MLISCSHLQGLIQSENEEEEEMWNLSFYKNEICFLPQGLHIEDLLESWWDNYEVLEENHSYIQWLFPLREHGMNLRARPLTCQEIQAFKKSKEVMERFIRAYQLMLRFYGIILINEETGELKRAENWAERFQNLNRFSHNNLRITRILKCLGEMGYEHYQVHLVKFFLTETLVTETLPNVKRSALDYFLFTVRSKRKRRELVHYAWQHFKPRGSFAWGPQDKLLKYRPRSTKSQLHQKAEDKQQAPGKKSDDSVEKDQNQSLEEQKAGEAADSQPKVNDEDVEGKLSECVSKGDKKCDNSMEKDENQSLEEQKAGDAADSQPEVNDEDVEEKLSECASKEGKKCGDPLEKHENQSLEEQEAGDAADLQPQVRDEDVKEKLSECTSKGGDGDEEKEASLTQVEEKDLASETGEVQGAAENDCTKESKKRKLDANMSDAKKSGPLKSPSDIENISRNLGECAIDAEIPSSVPLLQAEEEEGTLREDDANTKDSAAPETGDAAVKRRKVDKRTSRIKTFNLAINLNMGPSASSAKLNPPLANAEAEKENVSEKNATVEATSEKGGGDANGVEAPAGPRIPKTGPTSPVSDGLELSGDQDTARSEQHRCNSTLLGGRGEIDGVEEHKKAENASEKEQAEVEGKKQVPESLEQSMAPACREEDSAEVATQNPNSSERAAEPDEEQAAAE
uniref:Opioid growth factor receptor n=1 Tax=Calidris pygmaea TaxID=425635 RepID=A0A8C3JWG8_9CHAR